MRIQIQQSLQERTLVCGRRLAHPSWTVHGCDLQLGHLSDPVEVSKNACSWMAPMLTITASFLCSEHRPLALVQSRALPVYTQSPGCHLALVIRMISPSNCAQHGTMLLLAHQPHLPWDSLLSQQCHSPTNLLSHTCHPLPQEWGRGAGRTPLRHQSTSLRLWVWLSWLWQGKGDSNYGLQDSALLA